MTHGIHIHEDDWGMRSLHPIAAWRDAIADLGEAVEAGNRNRSPDGIGWTAMHVIKEPTADFSSLAMSLGAIASRLQTVMPRVRRFTATASAGFDTSRRDPYGSYDDDAWAFGFDAACFVKLEPAGTLVSRIWFEARTDDRERLAALRRAITMIDDAAEAMIIDYWADAAGRVRDAAFLDRYFTWLASGES